MAAWHTRSTRLLEVSWRGRVFRRNYPDSEISACGARRRSAGGRARAVGPERREGDRTVQFNTGQRELTLKIVYYGPGLSGKTTNLRALYQRIQPELRGHLMTLDTADDRTLFFDTLPLVFTAGNLKVKLKLFTVPGQVMHNSTRRIVLQGADAIAFIADSQPSKRQENYKYWLNMVENLKANGLDIDSMPNVVQWNKKDLGDASTNEAIEKMRRENKQPVYEAVAVQGEGVAESIIHKQLVLGELLDLQSFTNVCRTFVDLYKVGLKVFDANGTKLVDMKVASGDFCAYMFTGPNGRRL